jgi:hypothetical protein
MATIESQMESKSPEELTQIAEEGFGKYEFEENKIYSVEEIEEMFRYMYAVTTAEDHEEGSRMLEGLKPALDRLTSEPPISPRVLDLLIEWSLIAIRLTPEDRTDFVCMPIYLDLLESIEKAPEDQHYKQVRVYLQMTYHYNFWLQKGGDQNLLSEEDYEILSTADETFRRLLAEYLESTKAAGNIVGQIALHRMGSRFHINGNKPNEGIEQLKAIAPLLPLAPDYHAADSGDLWLEIGKVFLNFKKYQTAKKYFVMAKEVYDSLGAEWEMISIQADAYIDACDIHLK